MSNRVIPDWFKGEEDENEQQNIDHNMEIGK